jgi:hypothetical protein
LSHSTIPFYCDGFFWDKVWLNYLPELTLKSNPPDCCLLSS